MGIRRRASAVFRVLPAVLAGVLLLACNTLRVQTTSIPSGENRPLHVVQLSDFHYESGRSINDQAIAAINAERPDLLVFTGDLLTFGRYFEGLLACLGTLDVACPKFAVPGNWEYGIGVPIATLRSRLAELGIILLVNEGTTLDLGGRTVQVYGVDDRMRGRPDFSAFRPDPGGLNLVLAHCPILFDELNRLYADTGPGAADILMLSGHTHGGQVTLFGWPLILPAGSGRYAAGLYVHGRHRLFVSRGLGNRRIDLRLFADSAVEVIVFAP